MNLRPISFLINALAVLLALAGPASEAGAQSSSPDAIVIGQVTDESGAVIANVSVAIADRATHVQRSTTTRQDGQYVIGGLPAGRYVITATHAGFAPLRIERIVVAAGERRAVPIVLRVAPLSERVAVEGSTGYTGEAGFGKRNQSLREIPQSVSVLTQQRIVDQQITDVTEALNQSTGITVVKSGDTVQTIYARGFSVTNVQTDGGAPAVLNTYNIYGLPDLAAYDRVEVLRGADGLFAGAGEAGGTVNLVRKRPSATRQVTFDVSAGSWNNYRAQLDVTGALGWNGRLRGRAVVAQEDREYFYDVAHSNRTALYGALDADLSSRTLLTVGASYDRRDALPFDTGLPRYSSGADLQLPRDTCLCSTWTFWDTSTPEVFANLQHAFDPNWTLKVNVSRQRKKFETRYTRALGSVDPVAGDGDFLWGNYVGYNPRQTLADASLHGRFSLLGRRQEIVVGASRQNVDADEYYYGGLDFMVPVNVFAFDRNAPAYADPGSPAYHFYTMEKWGQRQNGGYASLRSEIFPGLHAVAGARYSNYHAASVLSMRDEATNAETYRSDQSYTESNIWTPYAGLTYDVSQSVSLYGSYAEIFKPQGEYVTPEGEALPPVTGRSVEFGAKGSWMQGALNASLAGYQVKRRDAAVAIVGAGGTFGDFNCCYVPAATIESYGVDAEVTGQVTRQWQVFTGYTYNVNRYETGYGASDGVAYMPQTPKHLVKLWTMTQLPGRLSAWRVGGGLNAQTHTTMRGNGVRYEAGTGRVIARVPYVATQDAYATASVRAEYRVSAHWIAALNVNNLFDQTYYQTVGPSTGGNFYGEPRNVMLTLRIRY
jgi:outer-membrane receptor for ferric coprogen and ferric-rhodotorulic acid